MSHNGSPLLEACTHERHAVHHGGVSREMLLLPSSSLAWQSPALSYCLAGCISGVCLRIIVSSGPSLMSLPLLPSPFPSLCTTFQLQPATGGNHVI